MPGLRVGTRVNEAESVGRSVADRFRDVSPHVPAELGKRGSDRA